MLANKNGFTHLQSYCVPCLVISIWLFLILCPCFAQAQLNTAVSLDFSDICTTVTINKQETIGITLQSNLAEDCQWILNAASLNTEVIGEIGASDSSGSSSDESDSNDVESGKHYIRWIFISRDSDPNSAKVRKVLRSIEERN